MHLYLYSFLSKMYAFFEGVCMLHLVIVFLILAIIAGYFGFYTVEGMSIDIAKILFFIFLVLFLLSLVSSFVRGKRPPME
jgi:uncharacterized membrane protein YtjA (UPF0391 family)